MLKKEVPTEELQPKIILKTASVTKLQKTRIIKGPAFKK